jgi:phosphatidate cytidylyltransferase
LIRTRLIVGWTLALAATGLLIVDRWLAPWFPCLFVCLMFVGVVATRELVRLFPAAMRPSEWVAIGGTCLILGSNFASAALPSADFGSRLIGIVVAVFLVSFLVEMWRFREPGHALPRLGLTTFAFVYLGVLGSFLAQIRWLGDPVQTGYMLAATIFVPKWCDIGAFFTGTFFGRTKMTPSLSPKKTWEGFAGGLVLAMIGAILVSQLSDIFKHGILEAAAFGLTLGVVGVLGALAESLIKRDCQTKDAAKSIPGFGGLLDVVDSVLFAAPVAYFWFTIGGRT